MSENSPNFTIAENELLYCLKLRKIIADDSHKVAFRGIWIDKNNLLACDGNRLGKIETEFHSVKRFMIPDYTLNFFAKSLEKKSCLPVGFYLSEKGYVKAISEKFEITFRQYDGDFITYDGMFDLDNAEIAVIPKRDLTNTIGFMCDVYKSSYKGKRRPQKAVIYSFCGNKLKLAFSTDSKQVEEEIAVENLGSYIDFEIALQPLLTYELLSLIDGDKLSMSFAKPFTPSIFYGEKENEKYLLVPLSMKKAA